MRKKVNAEQILNVLSSAAEFGAVNLEADGNSDLARRLGALSDALLEVQEEFCDVIAEAGRYAEDVVGLEATVDAELLAQLEEE